MIVTLSHDAPVLALAIMLALQQAGDIVVVDEEERTFPEYAYVLERQDLLDVDTMAFIITNDRDTIHTSVGSHGLPLLLDAGSIVSHTRVSARIRDGPIG